MLLVQGPHFENHCDDERDNSQVRELLGPLFSSFLLFQFFLLNENRKSIFTTDLHYLFLLCSSSIGNIYS